MINLFDNASKKQRKLEKRESRKRVLNEKGIPFREGVNAGILYLAEGAITYHPVNDLWFVSEDKSVNGRGIPSLEAYLKRLKKQAREDLRQA